MHLGVLKTLFLSVSSEKNKTIPYSQTLNTTHARIYLLLIKSLKKYKIRHDGADILSQQANI